MAFGCRCPVTLLESETAFDSVDDAFELARIGFLQSGREMAHAIA